MSVLFGIEFIKPSESQAFKDLKREFQNFKAEEEREDPKQQKQINEIKADVDEIKTDVENVRVNLWPRILKNSGDIEDIRGSYREDITGSNGLKLAIKGHTQQLEEIENKHKTLKSRINKATGRWIPMEKEVEDMRTALRARRTVEEGKAEEIGKQIKKVEEAMKAAATKQQQEIQAFKEEMQKKYEMISLQLQLKNAQINKKGTSILNATRKVLNPSGRKK